MMTYFLSDVSRTALAGITVFFLMILAGIFVYALYYRLRNNRTEEAMSRLRPVYVNLVSAVRAGTATDEDIRRTVIEPEYRYFERFLRTTVSGIHDGDVTAERRIAAVSGYAEWLRARVERVSPWKQALVLRTLSYFRSEDNIPVFRRIIETSAFPPSILAAGVGLALCDSYTDMGPVFAKIYESSGCNEDVLLMVISAYGQESAPYLHELFRDKPLSVNESCIMADALGIFRYRAALPTLTGRLFADPHPELALHIMDALKLIGDKPLVPRLLPYLQHADYQMRVKTALTVSALGGADVIAAIEPLLADRKWWVRRNAAEAILNTGPAGLRRLQELAESPHAHPRSAARLILMDLTFNKTGFTVHE